MLAPALLLVAFGCVDDTQSPTAPDAPPEVGPAFAAAPAASVTLAFRQVSAGALHSCGVTVENVAYCWGFNGSGRLGDGTTVNRLKPVAVAGGLRFRQVSAGEDHTCGITTDDRAFCWGGDAHGQVGDGAGLDDRLTPVAVAGGLQFLQVDAGSQHTCALRDPDRRAYCWGYNEQGQLGDGSTTDRPTPVAVLGGRAFHQVAAGGFHTCAVTPADEAYCWGYNRYGQLGGGTDVLLRPQPTLVSGGRAFVQVDAGRYHTCAVTAGDRAFCWGYGRNGEIGDGKTFLRFEPRAVAGGLSFTRVTTGAAHTCGETAGNRAYCWGDNLWGQLGDGTRTDRLTPAAVAGGLAFSQVSAAGDGVHTCGVTPDARAYCWGRNVEGELGDGTTATARSTPTAVAPVSTTHPAGVVLRTAPLQDRPYGVAVSRQGVVYAALIGSNALARGDVASMAFGSRVVVGSTPPHVVFNPVGSTAYATLQTGRGLAVVDVATNSLTATVPLASDGFNLLVSPDGRLVYVTTANGTLYVVNAATRAVVTTLQVGAAANGLAFSPDGSVLYVSSRDAGTVVAIDRQTHTVTRTYSLGGAPQRLAVAPDGTELYVANEVHGLDVVNVATGAVTSVGFGTAGYGLGLTPDGAQLYVLLPDAGEVRVLARATRAPLKTIQVGGQPRNVAFTRSGATALITTEQAVVFVK